MIKWLGFCQKLKQYGRHVHVQCTPVTQCRTALAALCADTHCDVSRNDETAGEGVPPGMHRTPHQMFFLKKRKSNFGQRGSKIPLQFLRRIESMPYPAGSVLVMDNASIHKTLEVRAVLASKGYRALFLPPYSPELNPVELVFGGMKASFYRARYADDFASRCLVESISACITKHAVQREVTQRCFRHVLQLAMAEVSSA